MPLTTITQLREEFEEKYGKQDGLPQDAEEMEWQFRFMEYCIERGFSSTD